MQALFDETQEQLSRWKADPDVLGVIMVGSKSRGNGDALSDDDLEVILSDEAHARLHPTACSVIRADEDGALRKLIYDAYMTSISDLEGKAASPRDLDHWPYEGDVLLFDRDGRVGRAVAAAGAMPAEFRAARLRHGFVDVYLAAARAEKCLKRGFDAAATLIVARGVKALSRLIFVLEGRWVPLDHWLEPELATLEDQAGAVPFLLEALRTSRPGPLREAMARLAERLEQEGLPPRSEFTAFFLEVIHQDHAAERLIHGLT
ncbi:hypothetical protein D3C87_1090970 [compost metagenome]